MTSSKTRRTARSAKPARWMAGEASAQRANTITAPACANGPPPPSARHRSTGVRRRTSSSTGEQQQHRDDDRRERDRQVLVPEVGRRQEQARKEQEDSD